MIAFGSLPIEIEFARLTGTHRQMERRFRRRIDVEMNGPRLSKCFGCHVWVLSIFGREEYLGKTDVTRYSLLLQTKEQSLYMLSFFLSLYLSFLSLSFYINKIFFVLV